MQLRTVANREWHSCKTLGLRSQIEDQRTYQLKHLPHTFSSVPVYIDDELSEVAQARPGHLPCEILVVYQKSYYCISLIL